MLYRPASEVEILGKSGVQSPVVIFKKLVKQTSLTASVYLTELGQTNIISIS